MVRRRTPASGKEGVNMPKATSKAQARLFGAIASGAKTKASGISKAEAKTRIKGVKVSKLPFRANKKK